MKRYINLIGMYMTMILVFVSCELTEEPKFLAADNLFEEPVGANTVLNGVYTSLADFGYYGSEYHHALNWTSGLYNSNKKAALVDIAALNPTPATKEIESLWQGIYKTVGRSNDLISGLAGVVFDDVDEQNNILGQAYFIRALSYFNLVRAFGNGPLITEPLSSDNPYVQMSTPAAIYDQIIADAQQAAGLLPDKGDEALGRPAKYAANMLLAKVYMQLAGNQTKDESPYWQKAYVEAIKAYGKYTLVYDFKALWDLKTMNNTTESVFEIQHNVEYKSRLIVYWTASNVTLGGNNWARFKPNLEVYDLHVNRYPNDPRIDFTFVTEYLKWNGSQTSQSTIKTYPDYTKRGNNDKSYPYGYKYFAKDYNMITTDTDLNFVVMRYAELLLMLAEIENELNGPEAAYAYVNEVMARARLAGGASSDEPADWSGMTQEQFRENILFEYQFELLGEGQDFFNVRRRGYEYFKEHVLDAHNNHPAYDFSNARDPEFQINDRIMVLPIPNTEISANLEIDIEDQNPGY